MMASIEFARRGGARVVLLLGLLLLGCGSSVHLEGELVVYVSARVDPPEEEHGWYALLLDTGVERALHFAVDPDLPSGLRIEVWGEEDGHAVKVDRFRLLAGGPP